MSQFQSYLIVAKDQNLAREQTVKLAKSLKIDLAETSPDIFFITPPKKEIVIDQIRELKSHIHQKPVKSSYKFIVIESAHTMANVAQNALLKILEEPPQHAIIVMEAKNKAQLLPTILSRVVTISKTPSQKIGGTDSSLLDGDLKSALIEISRIENPEEFLDDQIIDLANVLTKSAKEGQASSQIILAIEKCKEAKEMILANVNPAFTLTNLILTIHPNA